MINDNCARGPEDGPHGHDGRRAHCTSAATSAADSFSFSAASSLFRTLVALPLLLLAVTTYGFVSTGTAGPTASADAPHWSTRFAYPGLNRRAESFVSWRGQLVALGGFDSADGRPAFGVASWDGAQWTSLSGNVAPLAPNDHNSWGAVSSGVVWRDKLVVTGTFEWRSAAGDTFSRLAYFDGVTWHSFASVPQYAYTQGIATFGDRLFLFGYFYLNDRGPEYDVVEWDADSGVWRGSNVIRGYTRFTALLATADSLYAAGDFYSDDNSRPVEHLRVWAGDTWQPVAPGPDGQPQPELGAIAAWRHDLIGVLPARRRRGIIDGPYAGVLSRWTGTRCDSLGTVPDGIAQLSVWDDTLYAIGFDNGFGSRRRRVVSRWDGAQFVDQTDAAVNEQLSFGRLRGHTVLSAGWTQDDHLWGEATAQRHGSSWRVLTAHPEFRGLPVAVSGIALYGGAPWCATATGAGDDGVPVAIWSGATWRSVAGNAYRAPRSFTSASPPLAMSASAREVCWIPPMYSSARVSTWNGTRVTPLGDLQRSPLTLAPYHDGWIVAGDIRAASGANAGNIVWWDGSVWKRVGDLTGGAAVSAVREYHGILFAAGVAAMADSGVVRGAALAVDSTSQPILAAWDGAAWHGFGAFGADDGAPRVRQLGEWRDRLVASGRFTSVDGLPASNIALWDGTRWAACGAGLDGELTALGVLHGDLVVAGQFTHAGDVAAQGIARWDGTSWRAFAAGIEGGTVNALASWHNTLLAGGDFTRAGGESSSNIAMWEGEPGVPDDSTAAPLPSLTVTISQPAVVARSMEITLRTGARQWVRAVIRDVTGRQRARLLDGELDSGEHVITWNAADADGRRLAAGIYWLVLESPGTRVARRVVVLR